MGAKVSYFGGYLQYLWQLTSGAVKSAKGVASVLVTLWGFLAPSLPFQIDLSPELIAVLRIAAIALFPLAIINEAYKLHRAEIAKNYPAKKWDDLNTGVQTTADIIARGTFVRDAFTQNNDVAARQKYAEEMRDLGQRARLVVEQYFPSSELKKYDGAMIKAGVEYPDQALFNRRLVLLNEIVQLGRERLKTMQH